MHLATYLYLAVLGTASFSISAPLPNVPSASIERYHAPLTVRSVDSPGASEIVDVPEDESLSKKAATPQPEYFW